MTRPFDIVVFGATGYTGRLVSEYLSKAPSAAGATWAIAGRTESKLTAVAKEIGKADIPVLVADSTSAASLDEVCKKAKVVIACAGPFAQVGMPVVDACVRNGTHYVDITGEPQFVRAVIEKHNETATSNGTFVVPTSGFDCVPSDLMNYYVHQLATEQGATLSSVENAFALKGGVSRGTIESVVNLLQTFTKEDVRPLSLVPKDVASANKGKIPTPRISGVSYNADLKQYTAPFLMAAINEKVVRRSNALAGRPTASYCEMVGGTFAVAVTNFLVGLSMALLFFRPALAFMRRFVFPAQGGGPTAEQRANGFFKIKAIGKTTDEKTGKTAVAVRASMSCKKDGYDFTGMSAAEVALALVKGETAQGVAGGVLTPTAAVGPSLLMRLRAAGCQLKSQL